MAVYVDSARLPHRGMRMSHMIADSRAELLAMAARVGVSARWIQFSGTPKEHFDICEAKRKAALSAGAVAVSTRDIVRMIRKRSGAGGRRETP